LDLGTLKTPEILASLAQIRRGVERECLRINGNGTLSQKPHPESLGAALTHETVTTDFSESLLEFITPPEQDVNKTMGQLHDIHKFVLSELDDEYLWPMSMPCFITDQNQIPLAYYGESNVGKMKRVYRAGLKNRYGSMMQAIAGVHFNFSFSDEFWQELARVKGETCDQDWISAQYFSLIRNYRRFCWLIPFLYGASPALCSSFLKGKEHKLPFEKLGKGTLYLPYATSLRMSDLGYTNSEQSALKICYNQLDTYIDVLRKAMYTPSERFSRFAAGEGGNFQQLSKNVLQIENELYSPIRPKQPTASMEKPTDALARRGVSYIEVRALDVNPFSPVGIERSQFDFLDVFLLTCLLLPSDDLDADSFKESDTNLNRVVLEGRKPGLTLVRDGEEIAMTDWAGELFTEFRKVASLLDEATQDKDYASVIESEWKKVLDPSLTLSGRWLDRLKKQGDNGVVGAELAQEYGRKISEYKYEYTQFEDFVEAAKTSIAAQKELEASDTVPFDEFIRDYFAQPPAK
jgi:glutamate--cysteine ligase